MIDSAAAKRHIDTLGAAPRAAGTEEESRARAHCAQYLREFGFDVREQEFVYSRLPAIGGLPIAGTFLMLTGVALVLWTGEGHGSWPRGLASLAALLVLAFWCWFALVVVRGRVFPGSLFHAAGTNLVATRGSSTPKVWLCAHVDTKSQPFPTIARTIGLLLAVVTTFSLVLFIFVDALIADSSNIWMTLGIAATVAALPLLASTVGNDSPGAADNASGMAAVLLAARETGSIPIGVLITSAEELWLAGARAWAREHAAEHGSGTAVVINCDTVDEGGTMRCVYHRRADRPLARRLAARGASLGMKVRLTRHTPGILVDSSALTRGGVPAVTVSRVTFGTLSRIHTPRDTRDRLSGEGAAAAAMLIAGAVEELA